MNIRAAKNEDLSKILEQLFSLKEHEEELGFTGYVDDRTFLQEVSKYLILAMDRGDYFIYVAEEDGEVIGTLIGCLEPTETFYKYDLLGCIQFIYVDPNKRGRSVDIALVEEFEDEMQKTGVGAIYATVHQANTLPQFKLLHRGWRYQFVQLYREVQ